MRWTRDCNLHMGDEKFPQNLVGMTQMKGSLGNPVHRWMENIKMDLLGMSV